MKHLKNFNELNESLINKILNRNYIKKIDNLIEKGSNNEMIDFLESMIDKTYFGENASSVAKLELLRTESNNGVNRADVKRILYSIKKYLEETNIKNLRIWGPNQGLNGWMVTDMNVSFSG